MAFTDLTAVAQEGWNWWAAKQRRADGSLIFKDGADAADGQNESQGRQFYQQIQQAQKDILAVAVTKLDAPTKAKVDAAVAAEIAAQPVTAVAEVVAEEVIK